MNSHFKQLYPTDALFGSFSDYDRLDQLISELMTNVELNPNTNMLGEDSLFNRLDELPELALFKEAVIEPAFEKYTTELYNLTFADLSKNDNSYSFKSWLSGDRMSVHNHNNSYFSAVFYLLTESGKGGEIEFSDPRSNANRGYQREFLEKFKNIRIQPKSGDFVIFPAYLYHSVLPFCGNVRLSMPVDMFIYRS